MSLRLRLLVAVGAIAVIALVVADFATYSSLRSFLYNQDDQSMAQSGLHITRFLDEGTCPSPSSDTLFGGPEGGGAPPSGGGGAGGGGNGFGYYPFIEIQTTSGRVLGRQCPAYVGTTTYSPRLPSQLPRPAAEMGAANYFTAAATKSGGPAFRVRVSRGTVTNVVTGAVQDVVIVVGEPIAGTTNTLHTLLLIELAVTAGALVLAMAGGWWLVRLGLRPLEDVERTADSIAAGNLDQRVPGADDATEVGRLARALNVMLERIQAAFSARVASEARLQESDRHLRQFVADTSHELRTPIAAVSAYAELFERGAAQHADDLPRIFTGIRTETVRMERLVNDLLTLARFDEGLPIQTVPTELVGLGAEAVRTATTVGPQWPVQFTASHPVEVMGDPVRLRQVIDNLLANVRAHTPEGTLSTVRVDQQGSTAEIVVKDAGPGMPTDEAARVFERFYRADASRARSHGGSGLGLSIVSAIVTAHGGTVSARSAPGEGMAVTVRLPVIPDAIEVIDAGELAGGGHDFGGVDADDPGGADLAETAGATSGPVAGVRVNGALGIHAAEADETVRQGLNTWDFGTRRIHMRDTAGPHGSVNTERNDADMTLLAPPQAGSSPGQIPLDVEIVVPVYNEAPHLAERIMHLRHFLDRSFPFRTLVTVVDNASTDETFALASQLATTTPGVAALHLSRKGRGYALRTAWSSSTAPVVAYMDVDLSTSLSALHPLVAPLLSGQRDVAIGTRLARGSHVVRGPKRELISRAYNLLLKVSVRGRFSDAQCGFKALRRESALQLLPLIQDDEWFFDTELLVTAQRLGLRISEVPVDWVDDPDSRVQIMRTALDDLRGVWRISHGPARRLARQSSTSPVARRDQVAADQLLRFGGVGLISTLGYLFLFIAWRPVAGDFGANALALAICTLFNTAVHRELSRTMHSRARGRRFAAVAAGLFAISLALTTLALLAAHALSADSLAVALAAVTVANASASVIRFAVLRAWVFRPDPSPVTHISEATS